jgi:hypothetical protein
MWIITIGIALPALVIAMVIRACLARRITAPAPLETKGLVPAQNTQGRAVVLYREGFAAVTRYIALVAGRALTACGYDVTLTVARPNVAPTVDGPDLLVVVAPTYFGRLARSVERTVIALRPLPATRTVAITAGASHSRALNHLCALLRMRGAAVIASRTFDMTPWIQVESSYPDQQMARLAASVTYWVADVIRPMLRTTPSRQAAPATFRSMRRAMASTRNPAPIDTGARPC